MSVFSWDFELCEIYECFMMKFISFWDFEFMGLELKLVSLLLLLLLLLLLTLFMMMNL
jgi:hypothetical protein